MLSVTRPLADSGTQSGSGSGVGSESLYMADDAKLADLRRKEASAFSGAGSSSSGSRGSSTSTGEAAANTSLKLLGFLFKRVDDTIASLDFERSSDMDMPSKVRVKDILAELKTLLYS